MKKIGIVGGGIAGLVLASFLKSKLDYEVQIFEKDDYCSDYNGIQISPNGTRILKKLILDELERETFNIGKINFYDLLNRSKIAEMNLNLDEDEKYITLNRSVLINSLIKKYSLDKNLVKKEVIEVDENLSKLKLEDNNEVFFDFIIVADGIFSKLRPSSIKAIYSGFNAFRGYFKTLEQHDSVDVLLGNNFHLVTYPINYDKVNSFTLVSRSSEFGEIQNYDFTSLNFKDQFQQRIPATHQEIFESSEIKIWPIYKLQSLYFGYKKTFYIGDSAHGFIPSRAQGASQAIEDAFVIFNLIEKNILSHKEIVKIRSSRIKKIIKKSENNLLIFHQSFFLGRFCRNIIIKIICSSKVFIKKFNAYIFDYDFK